MQRQIRSLGVLRLKSSSLGRLASSVLIEAARFLVIGPGGGAGSEAEDGKGAAAGAAGEVSDPCCLATAGAAPAGLAAMAERVRGPVGAEGCRGCEEVATTSVIFSLSLSLPLSQRCQRCRQTE